MIRVAAPAEVRHAVESARSAGLRIALVPTMGALHEGHLALVDAAKQTAGFIVMSVFVNPLQFGPREDFEAYPRDLERDAGLAKTHGVDLLFAPDRAAVYPDGEPVARVEAPALDGRLCGAFRPGHFRGVLTVVAKLLHIVAPDIAVFGRKDLQQLVMIRRMVRDLDFNVEIIDAPIVREPDGLALSSRNAYLTPPQRKDALLLNQALRRVQQLFSDGQTDPSVLMEQAVQLLASGATVRLQYAELVDTTMLDRVETARPGDVAAIAAYVGTTRLIDNHVLE